MRMRTETGAKSLAWIFPSAMVAGLSVLFFWEWHAAREQSDRRGKELVEALRAFENEARQDNKEVQALSRWLRTRLQSLEASVLHDIAAVERSEPGDDPAGGPPSEPPGGEPREEGDEEHPSVLEEIEAELARLPPLPEGVAPVDEIQELKLEDFLADRRFNPTGRSLNREQVAEARQAVEEARGRVKTLEADVQLDVVRAMETLRAEGYYTEYGPGEVPEPVMGLITAAEPTEDRGMRLFPFWEDQYPDMYRKREEKNKVAELAFRRLLSMVGDGQPPTE